MAGHDDFLNPLRSPVTLDIFWSRRAILNALTGQLGSFHGTVLDIGCGRMPYKSVLLDPRSGVEKYIGMDLRGDLRDGRYAGAGLPDLEWDGNTIPLEGNSVDCAMATEFFEQCPDPEKVMREAFRVLKPGGIIFFTVPFFWPVHDPPLDQYRFTPFALERLLGKAGFGQIQLRAMGGWDASLAQMIGLWVRRRPMSAFKRRILSTLAAPLVGYLQNRDKPQPAFADQAMFTGLSGIATKPGEATGKYEHVPGHIGHRIATKPGKTAGTSL
jgi:SAM-dependent methyltransferase